jgi:hypothetical protein
MLAYQVRFASFAWAGIRANDISTCGIAVSKQRRDRTVTLHR